MQCPKEGCDGDEAAFFQVQIRSADEPMTGFYKVRLYLGFRGLWKLMKVVYDLWKSVERKLRDWKMGLDEVMLLRGDEHEAFCLIDCNSARRWEKLWRRHIFLTTVETAFCRLYSYKRQMSIPESKRSSSAPVFCPINACS